MKKILLATLICTIIELQAWSGVVNTFFDRPIFNYTLEKNKLPYGEYIFIRSHREVTQILISQDESILTLYTDRDNRRDGEIHCSSYSRLDSKILKPVKIDQWNFNFLLETCLMKGDMRPVSTRNFLGIGQFLDMLKKNIVKVQKDGHELVLKNRDSSLPDQDLRVNGLWKNLTMKTINDKTGRYNRFYEVHIENSFDKTIKKIIIKAVKGIKRN